MRPLHFFALAALAVSSLTVSLSAVDATNAPGIGFSFDSDGRDWKMGYEESTDEGSIKEYVLANESVDSWSELVTIHGFKGIDIDPKTYYDLFIAELKKSVPQDQVDSRIISSDDNSLLGEWWISGSQQDDQHEWIRIFHNGKDLAILRYTTKKSANIEQARKTWQKVLQEANIKTSEAKT